MPATESSAQAAGATECPAAAPTKKETETETEAASPAVADLSPSACAARLAELFPAVFSPGAPRPLKLRIQADVQQRAPGVFTRKALSVFLHRHTTSTAYLRALADAADRIDLDGLPAGPVNDEHRQAAATELQR
ncbi:MAG: ProQ/FinO family protein, partial [Methylibium sp.]|nr:ProQ/FinO family protein [Methylibium sp.]